MIIGEKLSLASMVIIENNLCLRLDDLILVKCAETKYKLIQDISNVNTLTYNNKSFQFNLNEFICDLRSGINHYNDYAIAYVIHDILYSKNNHIFTRKEADEILLILLKSIGKNKLLAYLEYFAVRMLGRRHFDNA